MNNIIEDYGSIRRRHLRLSDPSATRLWGAGYTPYSEHFLSSCGMEVVLVKWTRDFGPAA
jgi:hypothetical protein